MKLLQDILTRYLFEVYEIMIEVSPYLLLGFFVAGALKAFMPAHFILQHLGRKEKRSFRPVLKAALFGVPLPLCSCGVIPAAAGIYKNGASKGATTSFLISTPETGVDSIAITYALLDPLMTLLRPLATFFSAILAGGLVDLLPEPPRPTKPTSLAAHAPFSALGQGQSRACSCAHAEHPNDATSWATQCPDGNGCCEPPAGDSFLSKFKAGIYFSFVELIGDIGKWLVLGLLLAAAITVFVPENFIGAHVGNSFTGMLFMVALATPMYVCATASTPVAAALALKGLSPGAALVFLLAGPATNVATIMVVAKTLGKTVAAIYVGSIIVSAVFLGMLVNMIYSELGISIHQWIATPIETGHSLFEQASAVLLTALLVYQFALKKHVRRVSGSKKT